MALSDLTVRQAKTTGKRYTLSDNDCLGLMVSAAGGKSWQFRYYWLGKQSACAWWLSCPQPARGPDRAGQGSGPARQGIDPRSSATRNGTRPSWRANTPSRPSSMLAEHRRKELKEGRQSTLSQILRIFNKDVLPTLGKMSIYDIRRPQLLASWRSRSARRSPPPRKSAPGSTRCSDMRWSSPRDWKSTRPRTWTWWPAAPGGPQPLPAPARDARVPSEAPALQPRGWQTQLGVRLLFLTGVRTGELRLAEPEQFDLDRGLWIIPPQIVKQLRDEMRKAGSGRRTCPLYRAAVPAGHRDRPLPPGRNAAGAKYLLSHRSELRSASARTLSTRPCSSWATRGV